MFLCLTTNDFASLTTTLPMTLTTNIIQERKNRQETIMIALDSTDLFAGISNYFYLVIIYPNIFYVRSRITL